VGPDAEISLVKLEGITKEVLAVSKADVSDIEETVSFPIKLKLSGNTIEGNFSKSTFFFELPDTVCGAIGIANENWLGGFEIESFEVVSLKDIIVEELCPKKEYIIPAVNGNTIPLKLELEKYCFENSRYDELKITFSGGIGEQFEEDLNSESWNFSCEVFLNPFIRIMDGSRVERVNLWNDYGAFHSPQEFFGAVDGLRAMKWNREYPYIVTIPVEKISANHLVSFGYETLIVKGALFDSGEHEFIFSSNQELLWDGKVLDSRIQAETVSAPDKKMVSLIPCDIPNYDKAVGFAAGNHFFFSDEDIKFTLKILTSYPTGALKLDVTLTDVYDDKIKSLEPEYICIQDFYIPDYKTVNYSVKCPKLDMGVYKLGYDVKIGDKSVYKHTSLFEVFDENSDESPQSASGLPQIHCGDASAMRLKNGSLSPWNLLRDHNIHHIIDNTLYDPIFSENSRVWELLKLYRRKWCLWLDQRTIGKNRHFEDFPNCIKNADYINYICPGVEDSAINCRTDVWRYPIYTKEVREVLWEFLNKNPEFADKLGAGDVRTEEITREMHYRLFEICGNEWLSFIEGYISEWYKEQWKPIAQLNPKAKRFSYGPFNMYANKYKTAYLAKGFGRNPFKLDDVIDGFWQYEDYPFYCDYKTSDGAFGLMTIKLMSPSAIIRPEVYVRMVFYCPDGFVGMAHPTEDTYYFPTYCISAQMLDYVYNTAYYKNGKYGYWKDNQYMCPLYPEAALNSVLEAQKQIVKIEPEKPLKSVYFVVDFDENEDVFDYKIQHDIIYNISEANITYINSMCNESGIPVGAGTDFDSLMTLSEKDIDILVLPSLDKASQEVKDRIRYLYEKGVSLIAVSKVTGLEDIFGVKYQPENVMVSTLLNDCESEDVLPIDADFLYVSDGADIILSADNKPAIFKKDRAVKLNICVSRVGVDMWNPSFIGKPNVSELLKKTCIKTLRNISNSGLIAEEGCSVVVFNSKDNKKYMLITDRTAFSNRPLEWDKEKNIVVFFKERVEKLVSAVDGETVAVTTSNEGAYASISIRPMESKLFCMEIEG